MNRIVKLTLVAASALALGAIALPAAARSSVAFIGRAQFPAEAGCFVESFGTMINNCSSMTSLIIPLIVDPGASGNYVYATVTAYAASTTGMVRCASFGVDSASGTVWGGAMQNLPALGSRQDIVLPGAYYFNSNSTAYVACHVGPGGQVNQIRY
ncbi:hypothetical protein BE17_11690 [Sorangium cellulosum]|uniref:Secreted protein n=1 Tax=Sorangium cellulosum TaxID=56 RepID=A0A150R7Z0_SORCE|nr:hypothetical protein BE17_11690 [Sorangium cellulosum]